MKKYFTAAVILGICGLIWAFLIEPYLLSVRRYRLGFNDFKGLKIVFASDWHIAPWENWRLKRIVRKINAHRGKIGVLRESSVKSMLRNRTLSFWVAITSKGISMPQA